MKRSTAALSALGICLFAGIWVGSPFFAAHQLIAAAEGGNDDDVFATFDIPKVRENLRPVLTAEAQPDDKDVAGSLAGGLELLATPKLVDTMLDTVLTPEHLGNLVRYGIMGKPDTVPPRNYAEEYESPNVFVLDITTGDAKAAELRFEREGLLSWRVTRITVPALEEHTADESPPAATAPASSDTQPTAPATPAPDQEGSNISAPNQKVSPAQPSAEQPQQAAIPQSTPDDASSANQQ